MTAHQNCDGSGRRHEATAKAVAVPSGPSPGRAGLTSPGGAAKTSPGAFPGRDPAIIARVKAGETMAAVARDYGISRERVRQICKAAGVYGSDLAAERAADGVALYQDGVTVAAIAGEMGVTPVTVYNWLHSAGIYKRDVNEKLVEFICERLRAGFRVAGVAAECGLTPAWLRKILNTRGIKIRELRPFRHSLRRAIDYAAFEAHLLSGGSVADFARETGREPAALMVCFKRRYGVPSTVWLAEQQAARTVGRETTP